MSYIVIASIAWISFGIVSLMEKFLLDNPVRNYKVLTFYTGIFAVFAVALFLPFAHWPGLDMFLFELVMGLVFLIAMYYLYKAMIIGNVSEVLPLTGALIPLFSLIFTHVGLRIGFKPGQIVAFILLVLGTVLISFRQRMVKDFARMKDHGFYTVVLPSLLASLFFALYYTFVKIAYHPFVENFAFVRMGGVLGGLVMLAYPEIRKAVFSHVKEIKAGTSLLIVGKESLAGVGFIVLNFAISIGNPAIVNAMQGVQYVFVFIAALFLSSFYPRVLHEENSRRMLVQKTIAVILIAAGLAVLELSK